MLKILKIAVFIPLFIIITTLSVTAGRSAAAIGAQGQLPTRLTIAELEREKQDSVKYPEFMAFLKNCQSYGQIKKVDPRNRHLISVSHVFEPTQQLWNEFFRAAVKEKLSVLRAFALLAREIKKNGMVIFGPGVVFENAVRDNHIDLGLALPARNVGTGIWTPNPNHPDPEFLVHLKVFYTVPYIHQFPDHILPANLKIGYGEPETYAMDGITYTQHTVDTDIYYGDKGGIGFRNVKGIGGQKRGVMGFIQKVLFFLPDAVDAMIIDEKEDELVTEALVNTTVEKFEATPKYGIKTTQDKTT